MTAQIRRHRGLGLVAANLAVAVLAACGSMAPPVPDDPCALKPLVPGGSVELGQGQGAAFMPIVDGQDLGLELGTQGLYMFVLSARTHDLDVGAGDQEGVVVFSVFDAGGAAVSIDFSCRVRPFEATSGGSPGAAPGTMVLVEPYRSPLRPEVTPQVEGARLTIQVEVRDAEGRRAIDRRTVIAHLPSA